MKTLRSFLIVFSLALFPAALAAQGLNSSKIDQVFGRSGQRVGEIYKVSFPRGDLHVTLNGVPVKTGMAFGAWAAFAGTDSDATVMGDLVLLQKEVGPVMAKLRSGGIEITALHNHLLEESPHVMYMHYLGRGSAEHLAEILASALKLTATPPAKTASSPSKTSAEPTFVRQVEAGLGRKGTYHGGVLSIGVPRAESVRLNGMTVPPAMGVAESMNFQQAGPGKIATTGDFVLTAEEVNPVISALTEHHIWVTALHNHMLSELPRLFFMHFWAVGSPQAVAGGLKAALDRVHTRD